MKGLNKMEKISDRDLSLIIYGFMINEAMRAKQEGCFTDMPLMEVVKLLLHFSARHEVVKII